MALSGGVSGLAVGTAVAGGIVLWSAIRNVNPIDTLTEVLGRPSAGRQISTPFGSTISGVRTVAGSATGAAVGSAIAGVAGSVAGQAGALVAEARRMIGTPYVWASASASGVDCSGLVVVCLRRIGVPDVPRFTTATFGSWAAARGAVRVKPAQFAAGDVIVRAGHMGIAVSPTRLVHAPTIGDRVREADIWDRGNWWGWRLFGAVATLERG